MSDLDPALADDAILNADTSKRGWKRRAVKATRNQALDEIPKVGMLQAQFPIEPLRVLQTHIRGLGLDQAKWVRHALAHEYVRQGGDPHIAAQLLQMERTHRNRDVPRDQYGQPRNREGRKRRT